MAAIPSLVAACAECIEATVPAIPGAALAASVVRRYRAADGRLRVDYENFSMIANPATGVRILLDHLAQEVRILGASIPGVPGIPVPTVPGAPGIPGIAPSPNPVALGKMIVEGLELEGVRHVFEAVAGILPPIASWEVWTSTRLQMPVFTQTIGSFGVRTCICKCAAMEPPAAVFQVPSNYTWVNGIS